jgi:hypothetical protein
VNLRRLSNRHRPPWRAGAVLNRRTPDGSAAMHPPQEARTSGSAQPRPGAYGCEAMGTGTQSTLTAIFNLPALRHGIGADHADANSLTCRDRVYAAERAPCGSV